MQRYFSLKILLGIKSTERISKILKDIDNCRFELVLMPYIFITDLNICISIL